MDVLDLEGIDDDLELEVEAMDTDLDRPMSRLSVMPETERPTSNELRIGQRVLVLEKEKDSLAAELKAMKTKHAPPASTTVPVPSVPGIEEKIEIPHALLPILDVMRHHISELTRDNQAMRYTFGLDSVATGSKVTLDGTPDPASSVQGRREGLDLKAVVDRVRTLIKENEELGDMVLEAGRVDTEEWERALEDSQKVITSLDADLQHHAEIVQKLRQELEGYKVQSPPQGSSASHTPRPGPSRNLLSPPPRSHASGSQDGRHKGGQGPRDDRRHDSRRGHGQGHQHERSNTSTQRDRDRDRDRERERERNKEREKDKSKQVTRDKEDPQTKPSGLSIRGASGSGTGGPGTDFGPSTRREDDRASKRRK